MGTIRGLVDRISKLNTDQVIGDVLQDNIDYLADLNAEQINKGIKSDGTEMPDYSLRSVIQYGKPYGPIRLRDKGDWQGGLSVEIDLQTGIMRFFSTDEKDRLLTERYGVQIEGLSEKYRAEAIRELLRPSFKIKMEAATGLQMK